MVSYNEIRASNARISNPTAPRVAVFVGGTSGIGQLTIKALVSTGASTRIYLVGRKSSRDRTNIFIQELRAINPDADIIWTEGEVSLLSEAARVCEAIKTRETCVDLLFLTTGYAPFGARNETAEGVETSQSLRYYTRILFTMQLLPLLNKADNPRVVSVGAGGLESATIDIGDFDLKKPGSFGVINAHRLSTGMNTMALEILANNNAHVTFIHSCPGWVNTGNVYRGLDATSWVMSWLVTLMLNPLIYLMSFSDDESGQRHLYQCTSAAFGGRGVPWHGRQALNSYEKPDNGLFLVSPKCNSTPNARVVSQLREQVQEKIWNHTQNVLQPYL
jgi:NAD(P)-dependent dehydrogenase (short-subunit alcohol dehydrogenase family)